MEQELQGGKIEVIFGPMFSGKSTELLRRIRRHTIANRTCLVIKYKNDTRYADQEMATHDRQLWTATPTEKLSEIIDLAKTVEVIGIDEGQFFPDLIEFCENMANEGRTVIVAALDGTFQRKPFADVLSLIPLCENITKLNAVCMICYKDAAFTKRLGKETKVEVIGGADMYISVCRTCFHKCDATNIPSSQDNEVAQIASSNLTPTSPTCKIQNHVVSHIQKKRILSVSMD